MYLVLIKEEYQDVYTLQEIPDLAGVEAIIRDNFGTPRIVKVAVPVSYEAKIAVKITAPKDQPAPPAPPAPKETTEKKEDQVEVTESKTEPDQSPGAPRHRKV